MEKCRDSLIDNNPCEREATVDGLCAYHAVASELRYHPIQWAYSEAMSKLASHKQQNKVDAIMNDRKFPVEMQRTIRAFRAVKAFHGDNFTVRQTTHGEIRFMLLVWQDEWNAQKANTLAKKARQKETAQLSLLTSMESQMRVEELIETLQKADPNALVYVTGGEKGLPVFRVMHVDAEAEITLLDGEEESGVVLWTEEMM